MEIKLIFQSALHNGGYLKAKAREGVKPFRSEKSCWTRKTNKIFNVSNKALLYIALGISTLFLGMYDLIALPFRVYARNKSLAKCLDLDISTLPKERREKLRRDIYNYIDKKKLSIPNREQAVQQTLASFSRSENYYAPLAIKWVDTLLTKASQERKKLVFLARDGTAPYKLALKMLELNPNKYLSLKRENLQLAYFSRKVMAHHVKNDSPDELIKEYIKQLGIKEEDRLIFVDVGFEGSMIAAIKKAVGHNHAEFEYFISLTPQARGFIATREKKLANVATASGNKGIHWLEDSHQGVIRSPEELVREENGMIYPNTLLPGKKKTYIDDPSAFLIRKWSYRAIKYAFNIYRPEEINKEECIKKIDRLFGKIIQGYVPLFIRH